MPDESTAARRKAKREKQRADLIAYRGGKCVLCGADETLDFHHRDSETKSFTIASKLGGSMKKLMAEADKCDLLCKSCHRQLHAARQMNEPYRFPRDTATPEDYRAAIERRLALGSKAPRRISMGEAAAAAGVHYPTISRTRLSEKYTSFSVKAPPDLGLNGARVAASNGTTLSGFVRDLLDSAILADQHHTTVSAAVDFWIANHPTTEGDIAP